MTIRSTLGGEEIAAEGPERDNGVEMEDEPRRLRADAERNRRRLIDAATAMFGERGLDVGVGEIAERAGVGRGTLFRNFDTKEALVAAVVVERMHESIAEARARLDAPDPGEALFDLIYATQERHQTDRALFDAMSDEWMARPEIGAAHAEMLDVIERLVRRAQDVGAVRTDIGAVDIVLMIKGVCEAVAAFRGVDPEIGMRQLDLVCAAVSAPGGPGRPLRGRPPTARDLEQAKLAECGTPVRVAVPSAAAEPGDRVG